MYKLDGTLADDNQKLAEIRAGAKTTDGTCYMRSIGKVKSVAIFYKREFGLIVDVFSADDTELPNQNVSLKAALEGRFDEEPKKPREKAVANNSVNLVTETVKENEWGNPSTIIVKDTEKVSLEFSCIQFCDPDGYDLGVSVNWGDGTEDDIEFAEDEDSTLYFEKTYEDPNKEYKITIDSTDYSNFDLYCDAKYVTYTDGMICFSCGMENLTSVDISGIAGLSGVFCSSNDLSIQALNDLFKALPKGESFDIYIGDNPGSAGCDRSIAEVKGWNVLDE